MKKKHNSNDTREKVLTSLQERAKELNCLYKVEEVLNQSDLPLDQVFQSVANVITPGWQYPEICQVAISYGGRMFRSSEFEPTPWVLEADITAQDEVVGKVSVYYLEERPPADEGPFLKEEVQLVNTIVERLGHHILYQRLKDMRQKLHEASHDPTVDRQYDWRGPVHLLRNSDKNLYLKFARRLLNNLASMGIKEAQAMLQDVDVLWDTEEWHEGEANIPGRRYTQDTDLLLTDKPFELAAAHLNDHEILSRIQQWMQEDKAGSLIKVMDDPRSSLIEISDALRRYYHLVADGSGLPPAKLKSLNVTMIRRFLTEQLGFIKIAKEYIDISDFKILLDRMILPADSNGKLGGKGAGLLLANRMLERAGSPEFPTGTVKVPNTWYIASDGMRAFTTHNNLEDMFEQKYKDIDQVRQEYPNIIQLFKNSPFPPAIVQGLNMALDDLGEVPIIVRSSSLLEDRLGTAFSGKYKSLFLANQGSKKERFEALLDAIAEIYASVFGPDPIEYRRDRDLLDFHEEMGILLQEVVGTRVGNHFMPAFAGVAFSHNEFRWSPRIKRKDGLIRLVPGLGTRAVDRISDDYPILIAPGQPDLRVNVALDEMVRYSPKKLDAINLERNTFETVKIRDLLQECGYDYPGSEHVFSLLTDEMLKKPVKMLVDPEKDEMVVTFNGLISGTPFVKHLGNILNLLQEHFGTPVDIEFAHDGTDFYLLQCRSQCDADDDTPAAIPKDEPKQNILFSAKQFVSNGWMPDITHIVYVNPDQYGTLEDRADLVAVGRAVGKLNKLLPKRQFILMGPGRWGSRGDIKLGVSVTYADISNTAMLIEIARKKGSYLPDLSFGTHFFQDLVESRIRYLPLYPDEEGIDFNERFLLKSHNLLPELLPGYERLSDTLRVIDVTTATEGLILRVLLNADLDEALGFLTPPGERSECVPGVETGAPRHREEHWRWRLSVAEQIAAELDPERFGVAALYVFGSTKNATAGPGSDIDLLIHFQGTEQQQHDLDNWLEGWSLCLAEMNYLRTGYRSDGLLDTHIVTDEDIANRTSYAMKIKAVTDAAREIPMKKRTGREDSRNSVSCD